MIARQRAADRFRTDQPGITSWHSFSSGAHYDADNLSFGPVVACDEHQLDPGSGFGRHPHARIEIVSWVVDGVLEHDDSAGRQRRVHPGQSQYQLTGAGIEHTERNASDTEPLHFVQLWLLTDEDVPDYDLCRPPVRLSTGTFSVLRRCLDVRLPASPALFLYAALGHYTVTGHGGEIELHPGDSLRCTDEGVRIDGAGELLVVATVEV